MVAAESAAVAAAAAVATVEMVDIATVEGEGEEEECIAAAVGVLPVDHSSWDSLPTCSAVAVEVAAADAAAVVVPG